MNRFNQRRLSNVQLMVNAILSLVMAFFLLFFQWFVEDVIIIIMFGSLLLRMCSDLFGVWLQRASKPAWWMWCAPFGYGILALLVLCFQSQFLNLFPWLLVLALTLEALSHLIAWTIYYQNNVANRMRRLLSGLLSVGFGLILVWNPHYRLQITFFLAGCYFILHALLTVYGVVSSIFPEKTQRIKRKVRLALPVFFSAWIPSRMLREINESFGIGYKGEVMLETKQDKKPEIEVLIHMSDTQTGKFGHVDLVIGDDVISYGSYDHERMMWKSSIGDGVLFVAKRDTYIPFCQRHSNKTLISYGLSLNQVEYNALFTKLSKIMEPCYAWQPKSQRMPQQIKEFKDYGSMLYNATQAKFYKFHTGMYKTYFVLHTNCVLLADDVLGSSGIDVIKLSGIITPGTYFDFFEQEFLKEKSSVISRTVYK
ncbi:MAG: hypothetical protein ACRCZJ_05470 [Erysipelotrichaceae bacterium]